MLLVFLLLPVSLRAETNNFINLDELKPGMKGQAVSVFRGTAPEAFGVELQGVVDGPLAGSRYMLLKVSDESLRVGSGFSGSPVYFDGRLAGAISHMEQNLASQMAMAVPIARMLEDAARPALTAVSTSLPVMKLPPGSMIAIPLVRGDFWMGSSGTVTYVNNDLLLAFGHENFFYGDSVQLPIHRATVHGVIPRLDISHKEASPLEEIGSVIWDGKSALVGRLGVKAAMVPLTIDYKSAGGTGKHFDLEMASHSRMAPGIITRVCRAVIYDHLPNSPAGSDLEIILTVTLQGLDKPVVINQRFSAELLKNDLAATSNPLQVLLTALLFPLSDKQVIKSITMSMVDLPVAKTARIAEAAFTTTKARAGDTVNLRVRLSGPFGEPQDISVPLQIPLDYDHPRFSVSVNAGRSVRPEETSPDSIEKIAAWLAAIARSDELVILAPAGSKGSTYPEARLDRAVTRTTWNLEGGVETSIAVQE